jgi:hypothetical protein
MYYWVIKFLPKRKRPLERFVHRWWDNNKMNLKEICLRKWIGFVWLE